jgi:hypothetical protein
MAMKENLENRDTGVRVHYIICPVDPYLSEELLIPRRECLSDVYDRYDDESDEEPAYYLMMSSN